MKRILLFALPLVVATAVFADTTTTTTTTITKETQTWQSVPITVNEEAHTYTTVEGPVPSGEYYYTYPGYRCVKEKIAVVSGDVVIYHSGVADGSDIYCYPE